MIAWILFSQVLLAQPVVDISYVTGGLSHVLKDIEADPTIPGKEIIVLLPGSWIASVGRWHPTKHGVGGVLSGSGLCVEQWKPIGQLGQFWHYWDVFDTNADGREELIIYTDPGLVQTYATSALQACR